MSDLTPAPVDPAAPAPAPAPLTPAVPAPAAPAAPAPVITIGLKEVYDGLQEVKAGVLAVTPIVKSVGDHEQRLRSVERWVYGIPVALVAAIGSVVAAYQGR